jgi:hypothetical protein
MAALPAGLLLAGCGSTPAPAPTFIRNPCSVATQAEAAGAIGETVTAGRLGQTDTAGQSVCVFYGPDTPASTNPDVARPDSVRVALISGPAAAGSYKSYESSAKVRAESISGFGEKAYFDGYCSFNVLAGGYYLQISVSRENAAPLLSSEEELADVVLPKL